jgi:hypothetical protein
MFDSVMSPWDAAALQPIIEEAGGVFTDWAGNPTAFGGSTVATNAALSETIRELLAARARSDMLDIDKLDFTKSNGLVTVVAQDSRTGVLLMIAHADREALERRSRLVRCTTGLAREGCGTRVRRAATCNVSSR